jgi:hypothetical protein
VNGGVVSCRDVVDAIKDPRWLGLVMHEPGAPVMASRREDDRANPGRSSKQEVVRLARRDARGQFHF